MIKPGNQFADLLEASMEAEAVKLEEQVFINFKRSIRAEGVKFPVSAFPESIQTVITATTAALTFDIEFIASSILYGASVAIGNTHHVEIMNGYRQTAVLYMALVGRPGSNKSHPLSFALKPISDRDSENFKIYKKELKEFDRVNRMSKKIRESDNIDEPITPEWIRLTVKDFTPEALASIMSINPRGVGAYVDELISWLNNMDRYNSGSAQEFFLSSWSGMPATIDRKSAGSILIPMPFVSVGGTIQTGILKEFAKKRTYNGFLDRILFVMPKETKKPYWSDNELPQHIVDTYSGILGKILDIPLEFDPFDSPQPSILRFSQGAMQIFKDWQRVNADECNNAETEAIAGVISKMEMYAARFALILQLLKFACNEGDRCTINEESIKGAISLVNYFKQSAMRVHDILDDLNIVESLPLDKLTLYKALPGVFKTVEGWVIAEQLNVTERTYERFIKTESLFKKVTHGEYAKLQ